MLVERVKNVATPLKEMYTLAFFEDLSLKIQQVYPAFNNERFIDLIYSKDWDQLELKQRIRHITETLGKLLPDKYEEAILILEDIAPSCSGFPYLFFPDFVERFGQENWELSMQALEIFTKYSSSEFAVRPFIIKDTDKMMKQMYQWSRHENEHVRRLASEGCRPKLPWAQPLREFQKDPSPILPILEELKEDPSRYVQKSVANNLNDISKTHPAIIMEWLQQKKAKHSITDWILRHASRTLLKKGNKDALRLFGYQQPTSITVRSLELSRDTLTIGDTLHFSFYLENRSPDSLLLRVEYAIDYQKANGKVSRKKFHLSDKHYANGSHLLKCKQSFADLSTRKHYSGQHKLIIYVNGEEIEQKTFILQG
ncbi:3-methyladenine DNA glycosylase AlkC [Gracilibacillus kekensis]|uniref:3-methyladenine DNA glycosylase AlkC n=1 Tax=Gracilibacillus kekensis TaxID=1027249 RepID=A0A1M7KK61_9BACI|nr:3-methyladenine DNA glycosylase AlkC [Gracilibacillus kekensis]